MFILGLTGSIGMGKTEIAKMFRQRRVPVFDADAVARRVSGPGGAVEGSIARVFPDAMSGSEIDRAKLSNIIFADEKRRKYLEDLIHPAVQSAERYFLRSARRKKKNMVVLEIPLLFETKADFRCTATCVVSAPRAVQVRRVLKRKDMTRALFQKIEQTQMLDKEKRRRADFIIEAGTSLGETRRSVYALLHAIKYQGRPRWGSPRGRTTPG